MNNATCHMHLLNELYVYNILLNIIQEYGDLMQQNTRQCIEFMYLYIFTKCVNNSLFNRNKEMPGYLICISSEYVYDTIIVHV